MNGRRFLLHGFGPSLVTERDIARWRKATGKPFGVYGITLGSFPADKVQLLSAAKFVYSRDSVSLQGAKAKGARSPVAEFGPDDAFAVDSATSSLLLTSAVSSV